ncbi:MAG: hypothetical protein WC951_07940 [Bacteroidales bacterium]
MKTKQYFWIILIISSLAISLSSCKEEDVYDYDSIEPIIFDITGDMVATAHGNEAYPFTYSVPQRGGSSYVWIVGGKGGGEVVQDETYPSIAYITFNHSSVPTSAVVTVIETTCGGKVSEPFSKEIELLGFCPYNMGEYVGNYYGTQPGDHAPLVKFEAVDGLNIIRAYDLAYFINLGGEEWTEGDGSCLIEFGCGDIVTIPPQWIGDSNYPDSYGIYGNGTVDPETKKISLDYVICYGWKGSSGVDYAEISTVLTKDGKKLSSNVITNSKH